MLGIIELQKFDAARHAPCRKLLDLRLDHRFENATNAGCCMNTPLCDQWDYQEPFGERPRNLSSR